MNNLTVKGTQVFLGKEIPVIEGGFGNNQKVVLAKTIAEIHEVEQKRINELINDNIEEFEIGIDILDLKNGGYSEVLNNDLGFSKQSISNSRKIYLLSEQGYIKLYSLFRNKNDRVFKCLIEEYFQSNLKIVGFVHNKEIRFFEMLTDIFKQFNIQGIRQYKVFNYRIDFYIPDLNIAIEYDENGHKNYTYEEHTLRQNEIEKELECRFIRVTDEYSIGEAIGIVLNGLINDIAV